MISFLFFNGKGPREQKIERRKNSFLVDKDKNLTNERKAQILKNNV